MLLKLKEQNSFDSAINSFVIDVVADMQTKYKQIDASLIQMTHPMCQTQFWKFIEEVMKKCMPSHLVHFFKEHERFLKQNISQSFQEHEKIEDENFERKEFSCQNDAVIMQCQPTISSLKLDINSLLQRFTNQNIDLGRSQINQLLQHIKNLIQVLLLPFGKDIRKQQDNYSQEFFQLNSSSYDIVDHSNQELLNAKQKGSVYEERKYPELSLINQESQNSQRHSQQFKKLKKKSDDISTQISQEPVNNIKQLETGMQKQQPQQWEKIAEKKSIKEYKICGRHGKIVRYICVQEYLKKEIHLCNSCLLDIKTIGNHLHHQIICMAHQKRITFKLIDPDNQPQDPSFITAQVDSQQSQIQLFLCNQCIDSQIKDKQKTFSFVSSCHYDTVKDVCFQESCIKKGKFMICPTCSEIQHHKHHIINFSKESFMHHFGFDEEQNIAGYQDQFIEIRQRLKLGSFKKNIDWNVKQMWHIIKFLDSFAIHRNCDLQKWIENVLAQGIKEGMLVLWGVNQLKLRKYNEKQKRFFLEMFNDQLQKELEKTLNQVSESIKALVRRVETLVKFTEQDINQWVNQKYKNITNIDDTCNINIKPMNLQLVNPLYFDFIQTIEIKKNCEQADDDKVTNSWKNGRKRFFNQEIQQLFDKNYVKQEDRKKIYKELLKQRAPDDFQLGKLKDKEEKIKQKNLLKHLRNQLDQKEKHFYMKSKQCFPIRLLLQQKFTNLKILKIKYSLNATGNFIYSIPAFCILKIIHINKKLQDVSIIGVQIFALQQAMKYLAVIQLKLRKRFTHLKREKKGFYESDLKNFIYFDKSGEKVYLLDSNYQNEAGWIDKFKPHKPIKLQLNANFNFYLDSVTNAVFIEHRNFSRYFFKYFNPVSDIIAKVYLTNYSKLRTWDDNLRQILLSIFDFKRLKLQIIGDLRYILGERDNIMENLLKYLTKFTQITAISFDGLEFSEYTTEKQFTDMERYLKFIMSKNQITSLRLYSCERVFLLPKVTTLQQIDLDGGAYKFGGQYYWKQCSPMYDIIKANPSLKVIRNRCIKQIQKVRLSTLDQLQSLYLQGNEWVDDDSLSELHCSKLKNFTICNNSNKLVTVLSLQIILPNMINIEYLCFKSVDFDGQLLLKIPSLHFKQLHIFENSQMTNNNLQGVDSKWPDLRSITIYKCSNVSFKIFCICKFKGLFQLKIAYRMVKNNEYILHYLKKRGLKVILL